MIEIKNIKAREVLDSRGNPTIEAEVTLSDNSIGVATSPSGASTGSLEAFELRDGDKKRFHGKGVLKAVQNANEIIFDKIKNIDPFDQRKIDQAMIEADGSENKKNLGANAILAVSLAVAKAATKAKKMPLYQYINQDNKIFTTPVPMMNIINGGAHADNKIDIQEFMIMPFVAKNTSDSIRIGSEIFHCLKGILKKDGYSTNVGDEGGFAPEFSGAKQALDYITKAIEKSGFKAGSEVKIALDMAATELFKDGKYHFASENKILNDEDLVRYYENLIATYPIFSIEDACDELDFSSWKNLTNSIGSKTQLVGDDLFVTNPKIITKGIKDGLANAVLIKPNQIGTLTETLEAIELAQKNNYNAVISHRSGETEDSTISHIAVGTNAGQIKTGSLCRSDRIAKYNELIRIEEVLGQNKKYFTL